MRLQVEPKAVVAVPEQDAVFADVAQHGNGNAVNIVTEISLDILIRIGRLHRIDRSHQACFLVGGITVLDNVFHDGAELGVATLLEPVNQTATVQIALGQLLVLNEQRYQLVNVVGHEIPFRINDEALVTQYG